MRRAISSAISWTEPVKSIGPSYSVAFLDMPGAAHDGAREELAMKSDGRLNRGKT